MVFASGPSIRAGPCIVRQQFVSLVVLLYIVVVLPRSGRSARRFGGVFVVVGLASCARLFMRFRSMLRNGSCNGKPTGLFNDGGRGPRNPLSALSSCEKQKRCRGVVVLLFGLTKHALFIVHCDVRIGPESIGHVFFSPQNPNPPASQRSIRCRVAVVEVFPGFVRLHHQ